MRRFYDWKIAVQLEASFGVTLKLRETGHHADKDFETLLAMLRTRARPQTEPANG